MTYFRFRRKANPDPAGAFSGRPLRGFLIWCYGMAQYSPELIEQTISVFENRTGGVISEEDARQAVKNISGFFNVLQEWAEAEVNKNCDYEPDDASTAEGAEQ